MKLWVNGKELPVLCTDAYNAKKGYIPARYASVMRTDCVQEVTIDYEMPVETAVIRPLRRGITPTVSGTTVSFSVDRVCSLSAEINGAIDDALILFFEQFEAQPAKTEHFLYFAPGACTADLIHIKNDNTTVYFAEGAFITGKILAENVTGLTICGNGILSMDAYERRCPDGLSLGIDLVGCRDVHVRNIKIINSCGWCFRVTGCDDAEIEDVRIIGCRGNSDGVDVCGSRNVTVRRLFTRVMDDSLVLKAFDTGDVEHVLFEDCTLWNDFARPIEVGVEIRAARAHDVTFRNIDIIHSMVGYPCMGIHHGDRAEVYDILFEDIRIEDAPGAQLFDVRITDSVWNRDAEKGKIHDITFRDIALIGEPGIRFLPSPSRLQGFSETSDVDTVTFERVTLLGRQAACPDDLNLLIKDHVSNVRFVTDDEKPKIRCVRTTIEEETPFVLREDGRYEGTLRITAENIAAEQVVTCFRLQSDPVFMAQHETAPLSVTLEAGESKVFRVPVCAYPGTYVFSVQSDDCNVLPGWYFKRLDTVIGHDIDTAVGYPVTDSMGETSEPLYFAVEGDMLAVRSEVLKTMPITLYAAKPVPVAAGQVLFTTPETDFGEGPALINGAHGPEPAPQLRCPAEISYVFKNEPKIERLYRYTTELKRGGWVRIPLSALGLDRNTETFWLEVELHDRKRKYPYTLFHSAEPWNMAHMFNTVRVILLSD